MNEIILRIIILGLLTGILFIIPDKDSNEKYKILELNKIKLDIKEDESTNYFDTKENNIVEKKEENLKIIEDDF